MSLKDKLLKNSKSKLTTSLDKSTLFNEKDLATTKIPILNIALSGSIRGGVSSGLTVLAGPSKHFKSNLGLTLVAAYLNKNPDAVCLFYDSEFGITDEYMKSFGIDPSRVIHTPIAHLEELKTDMITQLEALERGEKVIVFIDSIGNTGSKKESDDAIKGESKVDFTRAKEMKSLFRIVTPQFTLKDIPCVAINHTIETIEMFSKTVMTGGCVVEGTKITMADGSLKEIQDIEVGDMVKTMTGSDEVTHTWNPETLENGTPECIELTFDDGYTVITSDSHKFLCSVGDQYQWIEAKDLTTEHDIIRI